MICGPIAQDLWPIDNLGVGSQFSGMWPMVGCPCSPGCPYTHAQTGSTN